MKLIITIDTEEDNWDNYSPTDFTLSNIERVPGLQALFDAFGVKPTYLLTYPVASDPKSVACFRKILDSGRCEIGTHCHPWNTPPFEEETNARNSMMSNLPSDLQFRKLKSLHDTIAGNFGIEPVSFRSGRWGFNGDLAGNLCRLGYKVDTSIAPYIDWSIYHGPDYSELSPRPFRFSPDRIYQEAPDGLMWEVPATIGFLQRDFEAANRVLKFAGRPALRRLRLVGILYRLGLVNKVWLSPENSDGRTMIKLAERMRKNGYRVINMVFHSSTLKAGLTPFVKTAEDEKRFTESIREFLEYAEKSGIGSITLSGSVGLLGA